MPGSTFLQPSPPVDAKSFTFNQRQPPGPPSKENREPPALVSPAKTPVDWRQCRASPLQDNFLDSSREQSNPSSPNDTVFLALAETFSTMGPQNACTISTPRPSVDSLDSGSTESLDSPPTEKPAKSTTKRKLTTNDASHESSDRQQSKQRRTINPYDLITILETLQKEREQKIRQPAKAKAAGTD